jgi:YidC/Oxa1 family membrane protein insertase
MGYEQLSFGKCLQYTIVALAHQTWNDQGLVVSLLTTSLATTVQSYALQQLSIRKALDIPIVPAKYRGKLPSPVATLKYLRDTWRSKVDAAAIARQQKNRKQ